MNRENPDSRLQALYGDRWLSRLRKFTRQRFGGFPEWETWFEEAHQNLALKMHKLAPERVMSDALVIASFRNELISVRRHHIGYPRPRQWLREFSQLGQDLFDWKCLKGLSRRQIIEKALNKAAAFTLGDTVHASDRDDDSTDKDADLYATGDTPAFRELVERLLTRMDEKKECDGVRRISDADDTEVLDAIPDELNVTDGAAADNEVSELLQLLMGGAADTAGLSTGTARIASMRNTLQKRLEATGEPLLSDDDVFLLRSYYFQGLSQNDIAKLLGEPLQRVVRRREAAIRRIGKFLAEQGFDKQALL
ncbi:MAG: hypothetical protein CSB44_04325 [Gammaproteobacteria bacterium]|nr:MAG: hypothetical protein CSB44_04325 [Gammaproteobacteria bacterium]